MCHSDRRADLENFVQFETLRTFVALEHPWSYEVMLYTTPRSYHDIYAPFAIGLHLRDELSVESAPFPPQFGDPYANIDIRAGPASLFKAPISAPPSLTHNHNLPFHLLLTHKLVLNASIPLRHQPQFDGTERTTTLTVCYSSLPSRTGVPYMYGG